MFYERNITQNLLNALGDTPVVVLHGARQTGKSTLVRHLAETRYPAQYLTFDEASTLALAKRDPTGFLSGFEGPVILDEIQRVPELLLAIKAQVDRNRQPGRFLLTGSAQVLNLPRLTDTLAGRIEILTLWPLSQGELVGVKEGFIDALFSNKPITSLIKNKKNKPAEAKQTLMRKILAGGYPEVLTRSKEERRRAWFESYLGTVLMRDVRDLANISGLAELPRLLNVLAGRCGGLLNYADLARDAGLNQVTLKRYFTLLDALFLVRTLQPWFTNRIKRLMKSEKIYMGDTGLLGHLLDITPERLKRDPNSQEVLVENFVAAELMKQRSWSRTRPAIHHFRDYAGAEVDFILEAPGGRRLVGIEVKASATVTPADFKGLRLLSEALGKTFHRGVCFYTGSQVIPFASNLHALPLDAMWQMGAESQSV